MTRSLLVFIGSPSVYSYINAMAKSVDKYKIDDIVLIKVNGLPVVVEVKEDDVKNALIEAVSGLVNGIYKELNPKSQTYQRIQVPEAKDNNTYKKLKQIFDDSFHIKTVEYVYLRKELAEMKKMYGADAIVDVSGTTKKIAIDVLSACLAVGVEVTLFELNRPPKGVLTLYHNLKAEDYEHVILPDFKPLIDNIELFAARKNRNKMLVTIIAIIVSLVVVCVQAWIQAAYGKEGWESLLIVGLVTVFSLVGVVPIVEAGWSFGRR